MTAVLPDSPALRSALKALPDDRKKELRAKRHPWIGPARMVILTARTWAGDALVGELVERFGSCRWDDGRWHIQRAQLSLFPKGVVS